MNKLLYCILILQLSIQSCIKDDFILDEVDPILRITNVIDTLERNASFQLEAIYLNNIGQNENVELKWTSSNPDVIQSLGNGWISAIELGTATIRVEYISDDVSVFDSIQIQVGESTSITEQVSMGMIQTTSSYLLEGTFTFTSQGNDVILRLQDDYNASTALPGLYIYLSNNRNSINNGLEIGKVETFSGAHHYFIENAGFSDYAYIIYYCKPFNVKVGEGIL